MPLDPELACSTVYPEAHDSWDADRVILYHLGLGAGSSWTDPDELAYVSEIAGLKVLPTFSVIPGFEAVRPAVQGPGLDYHISQMLHGEQELTVHAALAPEAKIVTTPSVEALYDKGKAALAVLKAETRTEDGSALCTNRFSLFIRNEGGFGGSPSPVPDPWEVYGKPLSIIEQTVLPQQAAIYRLSGDKNPLHIDPAFAKRAGFDAPILHGLCSYGLVCKSVVDAVLDGDTSAVARWMCRFSGSVFPGETIITSVWRHDDRLMVEASVKDRGVRVISNGVLEIH
jgi:acyl dehydratase